MCIRDRWNREHIGSHSVRHNRVSFCGQAGIAGSLGAIFSTISDNVVHEDVYKRQAQGLNYSTNYPDKRKGVHFNLNNNLWGTNFSMWNEGSLTYHFVIETLDVYKRQRLRSCIKRKWWCE